MVFGFPKKEKLIDTGFFPLVFQDLGSVTYWTVWFSWILNDCSINQLLTQKYMQQRYPAIAVLPYFDFMVITQKIVNYGKPEVIITNKRIGYLRCCLRILLYKSFVYLSIKFRRTRNEYGL